MYAALELDFKMFLFIIFQNKNVFNNNNGYFS